MINIIILLLYKSPTYNWAGGIHSLYLVLVSPITIRLMAQVPIVYSAICEDSRIVRRCVFRHLYFHPWALYILPLAACEMSISYFHLWDYLPPQAPSTGPHVPLCPLSPPTCDSCLQASPLQHVILVSRRLVCGKPCHKSWA